MRRILLICEGNCSQLEDRLVRGGCSVAKASSGAEAIVRVKHESDRLDAAILISTGKEMDFAEMALNLRDVDSTLEIIIVSDHPEEQAVQKDVIANAIPQARILKTSELSRYLGLGSEPSKPRHA